MLRCGEGITLVFAFGSSGGRSTLLVAALAAAICATHHTSITGGENQSVILSGAVLVWYGVLPTETTIMGVVGAGMRQQAIGQAGNAQYPAANGRSNYTEETTQCQ